MSIDSHLQEPSFENLTALVTGGGSGIGRAIALAFAHRGCRVAVSGRRREPLLEVVQQIETAGSRALAITGDVARPEDCARMVEETIEQFGALHLLVNNAGVARAGAIGDLSDQDIDLLIDVDLKGPIHTIRAALPHLRKHRDERTASILNISSSVTRAPVPNYSVYSAAKAGIDNLTRCLAGELAADRIRVNAILPGVIATPIFETMMSSEDAGGFLNSFGEQVPLGRVGQPEDIARMAVSLCDPANDWVTGVEMMVDGGLTVGAG